MTNVIQILMGQLQCKLIGVLVWQMVETGKGSNIMRRMVLTTIKGPAWNQSGSGLMWHQANKKATRAERNLFIFLPLHFWLCFRGRLFAWFCDYKSIFLFQWKKKKMGDCNNQSKRTTIKKKKERKEWFSVHMWICYMCKWHMKQNQNVTYLTTS